MANEVKLKLAIEGGQAVEASIDGVDRRLGGLGQTSQAAQARVAGLIGEVGKLTGALAGMASVQKAVTAASDYSALSARMALLTGSTERAADAMRQVYDISQRNGAALMTVGDSYAKIGQAMTTLGGTSTDTAHMVETVAAALRLGNASTQEADSAMRQFGQAMAKGKLNGDEFVSLMENAPYLMDAVAASLGKTKGDLFAMAEAGDLTAQVFGDAVLGSFDSVTAKAATLPPTIGQAMARVTNAFTQAAAESQVVGLVSSAALNAMGLAADNAGLILDKVATIGLVAAARSAIMAGDAFIGQKMAVMQATAANVAQLQSTVASTEAKAIYTGIVLKEAQATLASTSGLYASMSAQKAVVAATAAHTAATVAQTEAQMALNAATSLGARALTLLGGPVGAVTAVLGLGVTAWSLWGNSAKGAEEKSTVAVEQSTASMIANLDNQIARLERRNALAGLKVQVNGLDMASPEADRLGELQGKIDRLRDASSEADLVARNKLLAEQFSLAQKVNEVHQKGTIERARKTQEAYNDAMAKYAPQVDKVTAAIEAERKALGAAFTPELEARIKAHFASHKAGADAAKSAQKLVNDGTALYNDLMAEQSGYSKTFTEDVTKLAAAYQHTGMTVADYTAALEALLKKQPGAIAAEKALAEATKDRVANTVRSINAELDAYYRERDAIMAVDKALNDLAHANADQADAVQYEATLMGQSATERARAIEQYRLLAQYKAEAARIESTIGDPVVRAAQIAALDVQRKQALSNAAARDALATWNETFDRVNTGLTDAIINAGKDGGDALWQTLADELAVKPFKIYLQGVLSPISTAITNSVVGSAASSSLMSSGLSMATGGVSDLLGSSSMGALDIAGFSVPQIGLAMAGLALLSNIGGHFTSATDSGRARIDYSAAGVGGAASATTGTQAQIDAQVIATNSLAKSYFDAAKNLGIQALAASFEVGTNTGREGSAPNTVLGVNVGGRSYSSGEISSSDAAGLSLAASRALMTALQASELPRYLSGVFDGITASTATQDQITTALNAASAVKDFHDQLQHMPWPTLKDMTYAATQELAKFSGGLDALKANLGTFNSEFYSDVERAALTRQSIADQVNAAGGSLSVDQLGKMDRTAWRAMVEASMQDTSESGKKLTSALLATSGAFASVTAAAVTTTATVKQAGQAAIDQVTKAVAAEKSRITAIYEAQAASIQTALAPVEASISRLQSLSDALKSTLGNMKLAGADGLYRAQAQAQISASLAIARAGGPLPLDGQLNSALSTVSQPSERLFATFDDYARDYYRTANDISALNDLTGSELTVQQSTQELLQAQLTNAKQEFDTQIKYLDDTAAMAQAQLDAALGVNASVLSVADAVKSLHQALKPETPKGQSGAGTGAGAGGGVVSFGGGASGSAGDAARYFDTGVNVVGYGAAKTPIFDAERIKVLDYVNANVHENWDGARPNESLATIAQNAMAAGATQRDVAAALGFAEADVRKMFDDAGIPAFANGGLHAGGLRLVGERGMELEATGPSRIFNADQTRDILSGHRRGGGGDEAQLAELRALRDQNAKMLEKMAQMLEKMAQMLEKMQAVADSSRSTDRTLNRVTRGGDGMQISSDSTASVLAL